MNKKLCVFAAFIYDFFVLIALIIVCFVFRAFFPVTQKLLIVVDIFMTFLFQGLLMSFSESIIENEKEFLSHL